MKTVPISRSAVGQRKVDGDWKVDVAATENILKERVFPLHLQIHKIELAGLEDGVLSTTRFKSSQSHLVAGADNFMSPTRIWSEKFNFDFTVNIIFAKISGA